MKIWARVVRRHKILRDCVQEFDMPRPTEPEEWGEVLSELCKPLDLSRPVVLQKHASELERFGTTGFGAADFMESIDFDRLELEIYPEKKENDGFGFYG